MAIPTFFEPMLLLPSKVIPRGEEWLYELKFDGFRGIAVKNGDAVQLISRNRNNLAKRFPRIVSAVASLPCKSAVLDGEIVCLDPDGRPCFEDLQNAGPARSRVFYYGFDVMHVNGRDLCADPLTERKKRLQELLGGAESCLRFSDALDTDPEALATFCRENRLEGIVAKRRHSQYEQGRRSGAWTKFKTYQMGTFVVGGFLPSEAGFSALAVGFWKGKELRYAGKLECYWRKEQRLALCEQFLDRVVSLCPFSAVPKREHGDTWSAGMAIEEFREFAWLKPEVTVKVRFLEWTKSGLLRQAGLEG